jgi:cardiolipin synthase
MTVPNMMTLARIVLVPGFLISVIYGQLRIALGIFILAALTDMLDGYLARCLQQETQLGRYLDPLADKLLSTVSYVSLAVMGLLPAWLAVVVFFKDLFIGLGIAIIFFVGRKPRALPTPWGKCTTFMQSIAIGVALLWAVLEFELTGLDALFWLTGGLTIFSGSHYIYQGAAQLREAEKKNISAPV